MSLSKGVVMHDSSVFRKAAEYSAGTMCIEFNKKNLCEMVDISAVRTISGKAEVDEVAKMAKEHQFICAFAMPNLTAYLRDQLIGSGVRLGGTMGFPSGAEMPEMKIACAKELVKIGCDELDMVIAVNWLKSGMYDEVLDEIKQLAEIADGRVFKSIIEVKYLTEDEIKRACELAVRGGVTFVKSGTGWSGTTTVDHIRLMKSVVGNDAKIKAAGGVRDLATIRAMVDAGCERFGISCASMKNIMEEVKAAAL